MIKEQEKHMETYGIQNKSKSFDDVKSNLDEMVSKMDTLIKLIIYNS